MATEKQNGAKTVRVPFNTSNYYSLSKQRKTRNREMK